MNVLKLEADKKGENCNKSMVFLFLYLENTNAKNLKTSFLRKR